MSEKPIIFTAESVRAILKGRKTQTRRVVRAKCCDFKAGFKYGMYGVEIPCCEKRRGICRDVECNPTPKYLIGDLLWVKERYCESNITDKPIYKADDVFDAKIPWKNPLFMPRKYARLFLKVTEVRCERLHSLTPQDSMAEGYSDWADDFMIAWDKINKKHPWESNPFVWVYEFERIEK